MYMSYGNVVPGVPRSPEEAIFTEIYRRKSWGGVDSVSGAGSDYDQTEVVRYTLPTLVAELGCKTLLDIPCGDFFWMSLVELEGDYIGADIVEALIRNNERKYQHPRRRFVHLDLIRNQLPKADLVLCRDGLVHFSDQHVHSALANIKSSGGLFLLATTFPGRDRNDEITTGMWRALNLERPPFSLPPPLRLINEQCPMEGYSDKHLGLWRIQDLP
jgi:hypothetical protein